MSSPSPLTQVQAIKLDAEVNEGAFDFRKDSAKDGKASQESLDGSSARHEASVLVEPGQMAAFNKRLISLNKKAVAFGLDSIAVLSAEEVVYQRKRTMRKNGGYELSIVPIYPGEMPKEPIFLNRIKITYPELRMGNWRVIGKLEGVLGGNLQFSFSSEESDIRVLNAYAEHNINCDHCNVKRSRVDGYILNDVESGEYKQVGSNCLEDFTGIDPKAALFLVKMWDFVKYSEGELEEYGASGKRNAISTREFISNVIYLSDNGGFVSAAKARESMVQPTYWVAAHLDDMLFNEGRGFDEVDRTCFIKGKPANDARAGEVIEWVESLPAVSGFDKNVKLLLANDFLSLERKHLAFAAATVPMFSRNYSHHRRQVAPSQHLGSPGGKLATVLTINRVIEIPSQYGMAHLILMQDDAGNQLKWKASSASNEILQGQGRKLEAAFKIKAHDDYKGAPQTTVTHLKVVQWLDANIHEKIYKATIYKHPVNCPHDYRDPVMDGTLLTFEELLGSARSFHIGHVATPSLEDNPEYAWFSSPGDQQGVVYTLHVNAIEGVEPSVGDYHRLSEALVTLQTVSEFESDNEILGST